MAWSVVKRDENGDGADCGIDGHAGHGQELGSFSGLGSLNWSRRSEARRRNLCGDDRRRGLLASLFFFQFLIFYVSTRSPFHDFFSSFQQRERGRLDW